MIPQKHTMSRIVQTQTVYTFHRGPARRASTRRKPKNLNPVPLPAKILSLGTVRGLTIINNLSRTVQTDTQYLYFSCFPPHRTASCCCCFTFYFVRSFVPSYVCVLLLPLSRIFSQCLCTPRHPSFFVGACKYGRRCFSTPMAPPTPFSGVCVQVQEKTKRERVSGNGRGY